MKRKKSEEQKIDTGKWLLTYSDLMNNLLVLFIVLYSMSIMDLEKFKALTKIFSETLTGEKTEISIPPNPSLEPNESTDFSGFEETIGDESESVSSVSTPDEESKTSGVLDDLDEFLNKITTIINAKGYQDQIIVEKVDEFIYFRFREGVLFYGNQATLKPGSYDALSLVGDIIIEAYPEISNIEIGGHTAWVPLDNSNTDFSSWELSTDRSMTVMKFLVTECEIPKNKMTVSGYSSTQPYLPGDTEDIKSLNRRVEIRISRLIDN
ncbi:MAG: hypothetical protein A2Y17_04430 [Clostridiales bacterium GWF2_38_85]|nr:MAG: hypothetical protein A2Y17_04430 [Clostridiales bacterium GWF2_38_85]HBL83401.1 hypothetical protein [Clostridiales bacterium]